MGYICTQPTSNIRQEGQKKYVEHLEIQRSGASAQAARESSEGEAMPFVFSSTHDCQKPIGSFKKVHRSAPTRAEIKSYFILYALRHTLATQPVALGKDLPMPSSPLEHASILMTKRYVHPTAEEKRGAIEKFEKYPAQGSLHAVIAKQVYAVPTKVPTIPHLN